MRLESFRDASPLVIAISYGGTIVADAVAAALGARLALWGVPAPDVRSRTIIAVNDGLMDIEPVRNVLRAVRSRAPTQLVLAAPVADRVALAQLRGYADVVVALQVEDELPSIASRYRGFRDVTWDEARELVDSARARTSTDSTRRIRVHSSFPPQV